MIETKGTTSWKDNWTWSKTWPKACIRASNTEDEGCCRGNETYDWWRRYGRYKKVGVARRGAQGKGRRTRISGFS